MPILQIHSHGNGIKVQIIKNVVQNSSNGCFYEKKNEAFVPRIGSLSLCCWLILGHIGRGDLEKQRGWH